MYFIALVKTQQSIYSIKVVDKVGNVNKTTYYPVKKPALFPSNSDVFLLDWLFSSFHSEEYNNPLENFRIIRN